MCCYEIIVLKYIFYWKVNHFHHNNGAHIMGLIFWWELCMIIHINTMKRQSLEMVILDFNLRRIIITSDEKEATLANAFQMFKWILPEGAFYNSQNSREVFMTDNCDELRKGLHQNWPNATLLICVFHILH